jgi:hypothetical protein
VFVRPVKLSVTGSNVVVTYINRFVVAVCHVTGSVVNEMK